MCAYAFARSFWQMRNLRNQKEELKIFEKRFNPGKRMEINGANVQTEHHFSKLRECGILISILPDVDLEKLMDVSKEKRKEPNRKKHRKKKNVSVRSIN